MDDYDLIENPTPRCACALVLDTSGSMTGQPIEELNEGVFQLWTELLADDYAKNSVELGVFTFGGSVETVLNFADLRTVNNIRTDVKFTAYGNTPMGEAVGAAMRALEGRKRQYKGAGVSYYQPWLVLMTDGVPTDAWQGAARALRELAVAKKITVFGIGIGDRCNMDVLAEFCSPERPPMRLNGLKFREFFAWLSQSMSQVSQSAPGADVPLPPTDGWGSVAG